MWRHIASNALTLFIVILFGIGGLVAWGAGQYSAPGPLAQAMCLRVESGSNMRVVSNSLEEQGAVSSAAIFRLGADYSEKSSQLKAGSFLVEAEASMEQIVDQVTRGGQSTCGTEVVYRVGVTRTTIQVRELDPATNRYNEIARFNPAEEAAPAAYTDVKEDADTRYRALIAEGVTSWQVVNALNALDLLGDDYADLPAEGSLAPDSYEFVPGDPVASIIDRMRASQEQILAQAWANRVEGLPLASPEEALVLASIIEKETAVAGERRQVSSVFINRLNRGMRLQTDPTVIYGITEGEGVLGRGLRQSELRDPDTSDYIFFVADGTGGHAFATNLDDHNRNVARWREIEAERAAN